MEIVELEMSKEQLVLTQTEVFHVCVTKVTKMNLIVQVRKFVVTKYKKKKLLNVFICI